MTHIDAMVVAKENPLQLSQLYLEVSICYF